MRIIFTGPPGSGKTLMTRSPELNANYDIFPEAARKIVTHVVPTPVEERLQTLIELQQVQDYENAASKVRHCIFDRGLPDQIAYRRWFSLDVNEDLLDKCDTLRYDKVFYFPFWSEIYEQDKVRKETPEEAKELGAMIKLAYSLAGYEVIVVPKATPQERINFILSKL